MRSEFLKVRALPTPRWTVVTLLVCLLLGVAGAVQWGVGEEAEVLDLAVMFPAWIASLVFGVWIAGLEFGQGTLRRALSADPGRLRLILAKLAVVVICITAVTVVLTVVGALLFQLAGSGHASSLDPGQVGRSLAAAVVSNLVVAVVGMSLTLLTRSMAGGLTISFVFFFVLDTALSFAPKVGDYSLGTVSGDLESAILDSQEGAFGQAMTHSPEVAALLTVVWTAALFAAGAVRTIHADVK